MTTIAKLPDRRAVVRASLWGGALALLLAGLALLWWRTIPPPVDEQGILRVALTTAELPTTTGVPSGLEGVRFAGYPAFEPLVMWDLRDLGPAPRLIPWLATRWESDPRDRLRWIFHLRKGVRFHDGSAFGADAVVWNFDRLFKAGSPQAQTATSASAKARAPMIDTWRKLDEETVEIRTSVPTSFLPEILTGILMVSPQQWRACGGDWECFGKKPSGTGPFRIVEVDRSVIRMRRFDGYWNHARMARLAGIDLYAMAEPTTRIAALRAGEVDWIESPPSDAIPYLRHTGYQVETSPMPHIWPYWLVMTGPSPFRDVRVRQAFNYAIDRAGLLTVLNGAGQAATGFWKQGDPRYGHPANRYRYDPSIARKLLAQAGYGPAHPVRVKVLTSASGSGQMLSIPMNELVQQGARRAGFDIEFVVADAGQVFTAMRNPTSPIMRGVNAINVSFTTGDKTWLYVAFGPGNALGFEDPVIATLLRQEREDFSGGAAETARLARFHERLVDLAPWAWIVHDVNPRAFSPRVRGYVPAQSWFTDLTTIHLAPS